jgi:pimeloyl-ACP methyl ester carboxylesterase
VNVGDYVPINGHATWVEDRGTGDVVLLLHGGFSNSDDMLGTFANFADDHRMIAFDRRGHGRTADTDAPFHYADMADETIGVIEHVGGSPVHLVGYSDGGIIALLVALARPELVRTMVLIGTNYHHNGLAVGVNESFEPGSDIANFLGEEYGQRSPDGAEHFPIVLAKTVEMFKTEPTMTTDDLKRLAMPALVMVGDDDAVAPEHTLSLYESLQNGQLAVIPGASHLVPVEKPALVFEFAHTFVQTDGAVSELMPVRRAQAG